MPGRTDTDEASYRIAVVANTELLTQEPQKEKKPRIVVWTEYEVDQGVACIAEILKSISLCVSLQAPEAGDAASSSVIDRAIGDQHQQPFASVEAQSHLCSKTV